VYSDLPNRQLKIVKIVIYKLTLRYPPKRQQNLFPLLWGEVFYFQ